MHWRASASAFYIKQVVIFTKTQRTEQHNIGQQNVMWKLIDEYCFRSKNLYNYANYIIRQEFINNGKWIQYNELFKICKESDPYKELGSNVGQQTLRLLDKNWKSFFKSIKDWKKNPSKYLGRPKLPRYKDKNGRCFLGIDNIKVHNENSFIRFSWKPFKSLNDNFITKIPEGSKLMQCRFVPRGSDYIMEVVYEVDIPEVRVESTKICSIDLGIDNFATITNNIGLCPIVVKGKVIKSINQFYNKQKAIIQSELMLLNKKHWSNRLERLTTKRNNKVKHFMHVASKDVVKYCIQNNIDTLVCGLNKEWKQESKMSKKVNQKFVSIPYDMFVNMLVYKCENVGIKFMITEESYTSGTSFLDNEDPVKSNYDKSRRKYRGLFVANNERQINADVNGSYQIMKKVFPNAFANGIEGVGCHPLSMKIA